MKYLSLFFPFFFCLLPLKCGEKVLIIYSLSIVKKEQEKNYFKPKAQFLSIRIEGVVMNVKKILKPVVIFVIGFIYLTGCTARRGGLEQKSLHPHSLSRNIKN